MLFYNLDFNDYIKAKCSFSISNLHTKAGGCKQGGDVFSFLESFDGRVKNITG